MPSHAGKLYVSHCPNCSSLLKEVSPIPLCRCHACNSFLIVKLWKLEDEVSTKNASHEKHTPKEKSENMRLTSENGSISMDSERKPTSFVDACELNIHNGKDEDDKREDWECDHLANPKSLSPMHASQSASDLTEDALSERTATTINNISAQKDANTYEFIQSDEEGDCSGEAPSLPPDANTFDSDYMENAERGQTTKKGSMSENEIKMDDEKKYGESHERSFCSNTKGSKSEATSFDEEFNRQVENSGSMQEGEEEPMASRTWFIASGKKGEDRCLGTKTLINSHAHKGVITPDRNLPSNRKPVSMRTFRCGKAHNFRSIPADHEKAKTDSAVENMQVVPEAANQSQWSWESQSLNSATEHILYPKKCFFSAKDHILASSPEGGASEFSSDGYSMDKWASEDEDVVSNADVNSTTPSQWSDLFMLSFNEDILSQGNNETSSKSPTRSSVSEDEVINIAAHICTSGMLIFAGEDVNVASEATDLDQHSTQSPEPCSSSSTPVTPIPSIMHEQKVSSFSANVCSLGKSVFTNKDFVSEAADLEQVSLSSSASHSLTNDGMLSARNFESSARSLFFAMHPEVAVSDASVILEGLVVGEINKVEDLDRHSIFPVSLSEMFSSVCMPIFTSPKDEVSSVSTIICSLDNSFFLDKNVNVVSKAADLEQDFKLLSSLESCGLTSGHVLSPSNHKFSDKDLILTSPEVDVSDVSANGCSLENDGTEPKTDGALAIKPQVPSDGSITNQQNDHSSTKGKDGFSRRQILLNKLDEMKDELRKSMEKRKTADKPRSAKGTTVMTKKPITRKCGFRQEQFLKATKQQAEHYQDISPSSSSSCSTSSRVATKYQLCTCAKSPPLCHGNRKVVYEEKSRSENRDSPLEKRYFRPLLGGSPYVTCYKCMKLLQLPMGFQFLKRKKKLQCGNCLGILELALLDQSHILLGHPL